MQESHWCVTRPLWYIVSSGRFYARPSEANAEVRRTAFLYCQLVETWGRATLTRLLRHPTLLARRGSSARALAAPRARSPLHKTARKTRKILPQMFPNPRKKVPQPGENHSVPPRRRNWKPGFRWDQDSIAARHYFGARPTPCDRGHSAAPVLS